MRLSVKTKVFAWNVMLVLLLIGVLLVLLLSIRDMSDITSDIVNNGYMVDTLSKELMNQLLVMEESQRKYALVKGKQYMDAYLTALRKFDEDLSLLVMMEGHMQGDGIWSSLKRRYQAQFKGIVGDALPPGKAVRSPSIALIPQRVLDSWTRAISEGRVRNQKAIEEAVRLLDVKGKSARDWVLMSLVAALAICAAGWAFLALSINRPLRELRKGIISLSRDGPMEPIVIQTRDEFEDLASAFNDMAQRLRHEERMRANFISMLSHEIRTPLTSIREAVNLISEQVPGPINEKQRRLLDISRRELDRITQQLSQLIQVSRLESGALEIRPRQIDVKELVRSSIDRLTPMAQSKGVRIRCHITNDLPMAHGDPDHLLQILVNLIGNAIKFSPKGTTVTVGVNPRPSSDELCFYVSDQGPGIPEEERHRVFDKYYRASEMDRSTDGMGLGLSISKALVERHGGSIWLESKPGDGTTFYFTISAFGGKGH